MFVLAVALDALLRTCAPNVGVRTMTAIVRVESAGDPLAIHDNTIDRAFSPHSNAEAVAWAKQLIALNHSVDLGLAQINNANLPRLGMSLREAFDACTNLRGGATILGSDYRQAAVQFGPGQFALRRAIGAYNTGSLFAGATYVARILAAAGLSAENDFNVPNLAPIDAPLLAGSAVRAVRLPPARTAAMPRPREWRRAAPPPGPVTVAIPAPILVQVQHVDPAARDRAIAAAANGVPTVVGDSVAPGASQGRADRDAVVLHLAGQPAPPAAVPVVITGN